MKNLKIEGGVDGVGASQGWQGISILYGTIPSSLGHDWPNMTTHWQLTKEEIAMLVLGGKLEVSILGEPGTWPPIMLTVGTELIAKNDDVEFLTAFADHIEFVLPDDAAKESAERLRSIALSLR